MFNMYALTLAIVTVQTDYYVLLLAWKFQNVSKCAVLSRSDRNLMVDFRTEGE